MRDPRDATTLLEYAITSSPFPVEASPTGTSSEIASLTLVATNPSSDPGTNKVILKYLQIEIPVGATANDLTANATIQALPPTGWNPPQVESVSGTGTGSTVVAVQYTFTPQQGHGAVGAEALSFVFNSIQVNDQVGTASLLITESSGGSGSIEVTKFPNGWGAVQFSVDQPNISYGGSITLSWSGPASATYTLEYFDYSTMQPVSVPDLASQGQYPALQAPLLQPLQTTVYTLDVELTVNATSYTAQDQLTVTVGPPPPAKITLFSGTVQRVAGQPALNFQWQTAPTNQGTHCDLSAAPGVQLDPTSPAGGYLVDLTPLSPLTSTYTLTLVDAHGTVIDTSTLTTQWNSAGSLASASPSPGSMVVSPDGSRVYVANGTNISILEPTSNDANPLQDTGSSISTALATVQTLALSPDGAWLFAYGTATNSSLVNALQAYSCSTLQPLSGAYLSWTTTAYPPGNYAQLAVSPDGSQLYLAQLGSNTVTAYNFNAGNGGSLLLFGKALYLGNSSSLGVGNIQALAVWPEGGIVYAIMRYANTGTNSSTFPYVFSVEAYTPATAKSNPLQHVASYLRGWFSTGGIGMSVVPDNSYPAVLYGLDVYGVVSVYDLNNLGTIQVGDLNLGNVIGAAAMAPDGSRIYVCNLANSTINDMSIVPSLVGGT